MSLFQSCSSGPLGSDSQPTVVSLHVAIAHGYCQLAPCTHRLAACLPCLPRPPALPVCSVSAPYACTHSYSLTTPAPTYSPSPACSPPFRLPPPSLRRRLPAGEETSAQMSAAHHSKISRCRQFNGSNGAKIDFVYLIAAMPGRHSGGQVHKAKETAAPLFDILPLQVPAVQAPATEERHVCSAISRPSEQQRVACRVLRACPTLNSEP